MGPDPASDLDSTEVRFEFPLCQHQGGGWAYLGVCRSSLDEGGVLPDEALRRLFCLYLLTQLPDEALRETGEELIGLLDFYSRSVPSPQSLPAPVSVPARMGTTSTRPVFPVLEEE